MVKQTLDKLEKLAKSYLADEKSDVSDFQKQARLLQSMWRKERGFQAGRYQGKTRGNYLPMPWAKETLNNYLSDTIKSVVAKEVLNQFDYGKFYAKPRIFNNLLSSQPLCFNLFAELQQDLYLATKVFRQLCPHRVNTVTKIEFEYSPGIKDKAYLGDRTAFDVYVEFTDRAIERGFIGIEVKYHENLRETPGEIKDRYLEVASAMGCFKKDCLEALQHAPLEQIWRNHLLAGSLLYSTKDNFKDALFVFLYPQKNVHCQKAVRQYQQCLTIDRSFQSWTLEAVVEAIKENTKDRWIDDVIDRYLNFAKIEKYTTKL
jgi:hypothetical protein